MIANFRRSTWAVLLGVAVLLLCQPGKAQAHPQFAGRWAAPTPPGGLLEYVFDDGEYIGGGIWRGHFTFLVSHVPVASGWYELFMFSGTQGTISLPITYTNTEITTFTAVGNVDLSSRVMTYMGATYRP
jgi:hypothetical protein